MIFCTTLYFKILGINQLVSPARLRTNLVILWSQEMFLMTLDVITIWKRKWKSSPPAMCTSHYGFICTRCSLHSTTNMSKYVTEINLSTHNEEDKTYYCLTDILWYFAVWLKNGLVESPTTRWFHDCMVLHFHGPGGVASFSWSWEPDPERNIQNGT